jgi:peptide/nickel transport system permease protein
MEAIEAKAVDLGPQELLPGKIEPEDRIFVATQWQLMWWKFRKHRMAIVGGIVILLFYVLALFCEFLAPYSPESYSAAYKFVTPQRIHFFDAQGKFHLRPFVYGLKRDRDPDTLRVTYTEDETAVYPIYFFVPGDPYEMWGLFDADTHLFGLKTDEENATLFLLGADRMGRDMLSRVAYGARISMSIGLVGVLLSLFLGVLLGGLSGYYGGSIDVIIQRVIEFLRGMPSTPLWMALAAALPAHWPPTYVYFSITLILSLIGWTGLARVVRGRFLALREEDFVMAARLVGSGELRVILRHMVPSFLSYLIASMTLSIPGMILSETSLSFLGLGLRPPAISWGVLLQEGQNVQTVALAPWLLLPGIAVIIVVLCFNFLGDGLRDAADPYGG